ncbi:MAG: Tn3 family transposase [Burkholderiales bacterium]|nr:Tn3 family transposase [Burkholderiales bacterium]
MKWCRPTDDAHQHCDDLFTEDAIDWNLIACHLPDMLQVAQSIRGGCTSPSTILRKLGTSTRKNMFYFTFREPGDRAHDILLE